MAKGIRKTGSRFGARLEPTSHVALQCYRGRELDIVTQVETIDANRALREHYGCLTHAVSMLEAVDQVAQERERNPALYRMLVGALRTLAERPSPVVSAAFFWKLLSLEGFHPILDACARCGTEAGPFTAFDLGEGGVLCEPCSRSIGRRVSPETPGGGRADRRRRPQPRARRPADGPACSPRSSGSRSRALEYHSERRLRSAALALTPAAPISSDPGTPRMGYVTGARVRSTPSWPSPT